MHALTGRAAEAARRCLAAALAGTMVFVVSAYGADRSSVDLSETAVPFLESADLPVRVGTIIEWGRGINEEGPLDSGIEMPWGAVWQPALWVWGSQRFALHSSDGDRRTRRPGPRMPNGDRPMRQDADLVELAARMDIHANLQLSGTERIRAHLRPMEGSGKYPQKPLGPSATDSSFVSHWDADFETLFFEGEISEMFPMLDPQDRSPNDLGFAIGKFPVDLQNGYMVRDEMLAVGLSKVNIPMEGSSGVRVLGIWGFDHFNEPRFDGDADLFLLSAEGNFPWGLLEVDVGARFADSPLGDQYNAGIGWTHHIGLGNYTLHVNFSNPAKAESNDEAYLVVAGYSREINIRRDLVYALGFWADGNHLRLSSNGAPPLGTVGLSFAGNGVGGYRPALLPAPSDAAGIALGIQKFFLGESANAVFEVAHRQDLEKRDMNRNTGGIALTTRLQYKFGNRFLLQVDGYVARLASDSVEPQDFETDNDSAGASLQLVIGF